MQKLPKLHGFRSYRIKFETVYTGQINELKEATVDNKVLADHGLISSPYVNTKLIVQGELSRKVNITLQSASAGSIAAIEKAGGKFTQTEQVKRIKKEENIKKTSEK